MVGHFTMESLQRVHRGGHYRNTINAAAAQLDMHLRFVRGAGSSCHNIPPLPNHCVFGISESVFRCAAGPDNQQSGNNSQASFR